MNRDRSSAPLPPQEVEGADADLFDYARLRDYLGFVAASVRRHAKLVLAVFASLLVFGWLAVMVLPKTYHSEIKIQAQRNGQIGGLVGIDRSLEVELPTRAASDTVMRTDNLVSLVRKTKLVSTWDANRAPAQKLKDAIMRLIHKPLSEQQKEEALVGTLEKKINVTVGDETVTIEVDWWDAATAYRLTVAAYENFLEARQFKEVSAVSEAIGILENRLDEERDKVNVSVDKVVQLRARQAPKGAPPTPRVVTHRGPAAVDPEIQRLRESLQTRQRAITDLEENRRRAIAELETKMANMQQVYSEFHPEVIDLRDTIRQQRATEPPQLVAARQEYRALEEEYQKRGGPALEAQKPGRTVGTAALPVEALRFASTEEVEQPEIEQAKNELRYAVGRYSSLAERIDSAKLDRETQRAAFRYRYSVLRPASVPTSPSKPNTALLLLAAGFVGVLLGICGALMTDLRSRRIYQRWQVERLLGMTVLAEVKLP
jgi:uncharacterized protein involved in exopolysaccharide biosynthesis